MAKTKRKHLAALGIKNKQKSLAHDQVKCNSMVKETGHSRQPESSAQPSSTSPSCHQQNHSGKPEGDGLLKAELSHLSMSPPKAEHKREQIEAPVSPSSPYVQSHADDSDTNSWVDVRKQKVIIIIPPLPPAKPRFLKNRAKLHEGKIKGKVSNGAMYSKSKQNNAERSVSRHVKESICTGAPPISSMDILLASALDTDHTICTPWKGKTHQHVARFSQEEASLDTADSSVQPKRLSLKARKGLNVAVKSDRVAQGCIKKRKISLCKSGHPKVTRKPRQATSLANDALGHLVSPDIVDVKAKGLKHCGGDFPALTSDQAIKISTLSKHLKNAGGLRSWLCSIGLGDFKEAFESRMWSERDLLQLQMDDLKRMGKSAVGPRRKLIWAIHHVSHQLV